MCTFVLILSRLLHSVGQDLSCLVVLFSYNCSFHNELDHSVSFSIQADIALHTCVPWPVLDSRLCVSTAPLFKALDCLQYISR